MAAIHKVRALSLWQPWASLIIDGLKKYETRSWRPNYPNVIGSMIAIQAAQRWTKTQHIFFNRFKMDFPEAMKDYDRLDFKMPLGKMLGIVKIVDIVSTESLELGDTLEDMEYEFGDYGANRFAWKLEVVKKFETPIACAGRQQLWYWTPPYPIEIGAAV